MFWTPTHYYLTVDRQIVIKTDAQYGNHSGTTCRKMGICQVPAYVILSGHMGPTVSCDGVIIEQSFAPSGLLFDQYNDPGKFDIKSFVCYQNKNFESFIKNPSDFK